MLWYGVAFLLNFVNMIYMKFAVIQTGGKQYKVSKDDVVSIEKIKGPASTQGGEYKVGDKVSFDKVLLVDDGKNTTIGTPYIKDASVEAELMQIGRSRKVMVVKYKQKSRYLKRNSHRQPFFKIKILAIK
jgi:large subunit ribosomal protein L21